ncbi:MAG TPA: DUF3604 domain-containing protein [Candidatus Acidoferrales bacterium]|nr:DUF3604 domain-containing protein [Candidatus Acidoferrales bacterium]
MPVLVAVTLLAGCGGEVTPSPSAAGSTEPACADRNPLRNLYFGDLHVHTIYSFDAYVWDTRTTPDQAYEFARGTPLQLPPFDANGNGTREVQIDRPLDFTAVTDHSEFLGEIETCMTPDSPTYNSANCQLLRSGNLSGYANLGFQMTAPTPHRLKDICGSDGSICLAALMPVWTHMQAAAAAANDPCHFTSFVAYEYSRSPNGSTRHRNVIFRNEHVIVPVSAFEESTPQGLWQELKHMCLDAGTGCDLLVIPHNSNESNGRMFQIEYPGAVTDDDKKAQAEFRASMEPLVEIYQHKGDSECMNGLSGIVGATDEQCDFEKRRTAPFPDCGDGTGTLGAVDGGCVSRLDFVRGALLAGLQQEDLIGANPYRLGFVGDTDTHNGTPGFTNERTFVGHQGANDASPSVLLGANIHLGPGALTGVWAEQNSRDSLFDALRRKETFATSGTRISARAFGGWSFPANLCGDAHFLQTAYAEGVPMGSILPPRPAGSAAPTLAISALRDPGTADQLGTPLQRIQVIKGWVVNGEAHQQVYDVAGNAQNAASVDLTTCAPQGPGADALCTVWTDPDFEPAQRAFYYVRVLENPSCRWSTWLCNRLPSDQQPPACSDPTVPKTIQERAWTSPIWYEPAT